MLNLIPDMRTDHFWL